MQPYKRPNVRAIINEQILSAQPDALDIERERERREHEEESWFLDFLWEQEEERRDREAMGFEQDYWPIDDDTAREIEELLLR